MRSQDLRYNLPSGGLTLKGGVMSAVMRQGLQALFAGRACLVGRAWWPHPLGICCVGGMGVGRGKGREGRGGVSNQDMCERVSWNTLGQRMVWVGEGVTAGAMGKAGGSRACHVGAERATWSVTTPSLAYPADPV